MIIYIFIFWIHVAVVQYVLSQDVGRYDHTIGRSQSDFWIWIGTIKPILYTSIYNYTIYKYFVDL